MASSLNFKDNMTEQENTPNELGLITFEEGADLLGIGIATFRKKIDDGEIPSISVSDKLKKVRKQDIIDYVNNQVKKPEQVATSKPIDKVNEEIEFTKKQQELETLKAGFKTAEEFKKELSDFEQEKSKLKLERTAYETERKSFDVFKLKEQALIDEVKAKNISDKNKVMEIGTEYKKKWKAEDEKRQNENKLVLTHLDELAKNVYNMHPQYLGKLAKERLSEHLEPILAYYGVSPVFSKNNEYIPLSNRLELMESRSHEVILQRSDKEQLDDLEISENIKKAYELCVKFYKWVMNVQGGYDFSVWLYKELALVGKMVDKKEPGDILKDRDIIMEHFGAINSGIVELATRFDKSNHPNNVTDSSEMNYILKVSDEIERLLGVREGE